MCTKKLSSDISNTNARNNMKKLSIARSECVIKRRANTRPAGCVPASCCMRSGDCSAPATTAGSAPEIAGKISVGSGDADGEITATAVRGVGIGVLVGAKVVLGDIEGVAGEAAGDCCTAGEGGGLVFCCRGFPNSCTTTVCLWPVVDVALATAMPI